jgi:hypothetical protein
VPRWAIATRAAYLLILPTLNESVINHECFRALLRSMTLEAPKVA